MKAEKREEKLQTQNCIKYVGRSSGAEIRLFPEYYGDCKLHPPTTTPKLMLSISFLGLIL